MGSKKGYFFKKKLTLFAFVLPGAAFMTIMIIFPIISNIIMSFKNVDLMNFATGDSHFVGLKIYQKICRTEVTWIAVKNTLVFTLWCLVFQFPIGFLMALFFGQDFKGAGPLRAVNVVAWMIPMVAVAGVLHLIQKPVEWLAHGNTAMAAIIIANIWKGVPFNMILLATALTTVPQDIYESASIDGATRIQRFFYITVPLLRPAIISVLTLGFIYTFKVFDLVYVMTGGGPGSFTEMLSTLAYRYSFSEYNFSQGAAVANILFVMLMAVGMIYIHIVTREDEN